MMQAYEAAIEAGANRLCIADTVGVLEPAQVTEKVRFLCRERPGVPVEVHLHDDRGLAIANALAAIDAGAVWVSTSVNGLGERCGITDLGVLLANLQHRGLRAISHPPALHNLSRMVAEFSGLAVAPRHPVVGAHAFVHTAALHVKAVSRDPNAYSWTDPLRLRRD
jgi:2-isopropylmalate synthase